MIQSIYLHHYSKLSSRDIGITRAHLEHPKGNQLVLINNWGISSPEVSGWLECPESIREGDWFVPINNWGIS